MKAVVRSVSGMDVDLDSYEPADPARDGVWIRFMVGPSDGPGEESFDVLVCTPMWLRATIAKAGPQVGRHHLIVDPLDVGAACEFLRRQIGSVEALTWPALGVKLARLGYWEFEDYEPRDLT
jgi:hypothetical protein